MKFVTTFLGYLKWHYGTALATTFSFWKNILLFLFNYFSIKNLAGNFFAPWKRLADNYPKRFNIKIYFFTFLTNTIMRIVGIILRTIMIFFGIIVCLLYILAFPITLVLWLALPLVIAGLIIFGFILLVSSK